MWSGYGRSAFRYFFFDEYRRDVDAVLYQDVSGGFDFNNGVTLRAVISNVFDEDRPPFINSGSIENTDPGTYRCWVALFLELKYAFD
jgi:outer membrane receptor protein involved in Fe transport